MGSPLVAAVGGSGITASCRGARWNIGIIRFFGHGDGWEKEAKEVVAGCLLKLVT